MTSLSPPELLRNEIDQDWDDDRVWEKRLREDMRAARSLAADDLKTITADVVARAVECGALSIALTGSTALNRRHSDSDLDFYIVGERPQVPCHAQEIDVYAVSVAGFADRLRSGNDYLHWTLRYGLIVHDRGPFRWALRTAARERLWPDPQPKAIQARQSVELARAILLSGDHDAAVEQCRTAFSLVARWWLLKSGFFPRSRTDLPEQLRGTSLTWLGETLVRTIFDDPSEPELIAAVEQALIVLNRELHGLVPAGRQSLRA
jgi:hypothetical protein